MGSDYASEMWPPMGLLFIPWAICEHGDPWWWRCQLGTTPHSSTRALWQSYQQTQLGQVGGMDRVRILPIQYLRYLKGSLTCRKILWCGTFGFTYHPKEGVLRIFIALKNPPPWLGLNLRPMGPVASTLTTTPLRWMVQDLRNTHIEMPSIKVRNQKLFTFSYLKCFSKLIEIVWKLYGDQGKGKPFN
jgi:hypothetical protein